MRGRGQISFSECEAQQESKHSCCRQTRKNGLKFQALIPPPYPRPPIMNFSNVYRSNRNGKALRGLGRSEHQAPSPTGAPPGQETAPCLRPESRSAALAL